MTRFRGLRRALPLVLAVAGVAPPAAAEPPISQPTEAVPVRPLLLSSERLTDWVSQRHPDVAAADARVEQSQAQVGQSRVLPNPTLTAAVGGILIGSSNPSGLSTGDTMNVTVGVSELVELGKRGPRGRAAELKRDASRASRLSVLSDRVADARDALARVVYLGERQRVLEERLKSAQDVAGLAEVRLKNGDISGIDQDRLTLEAIAVSRELSENQGSREASLADCAALLVGDCNGSSGGMVDVDGSAPVPERFAGLDELVNKRPDLRAARLSRAAAEADSVYYGRYAIPDPTVGVAYTPDFMTSAGNQPHTLMASISMPLPLFDHGQNLSRASASEARAWGQSARAIEQRAVTETRSLLVRKKVLEAKLQQLQASALPRSTGVLHSSEDAYRHGQLSLTDLLLVRREHASLLLDDLDTRYELFNLRNTLYRSLGLSVIPGAGTTP